MPFVCCFFYASLPRSSLVSVVFDFNASLNDAVPASPILFSVYWMIMEEQIVDGCHLCVVSFAFTMQIEVSECCI